ncbi:MAG: chitosanase [Micrococcales bacterium]|nr:chitosanase [Micrococcales bacterium]
MILSSAENSSLQWEKQYGYIEYNVEGNAAENRGYTGGIVGFTSKTHDMLQLVRLYAKAAPDNPLARFLPALADVDGTSSANGLGDPFVTAWKQAARTPAFGQAQRDLADSMYLRPAVETARKDGLGRLGQFIYYDALVMHGPGDDPLSFGGIRAAAVEKALPASAGGDETAYLQAFIDARRVAMKAERGHRDTSRLDAQTSFLREQNLSLALPLSWSVYGDHYSIAAAGASGC